MTKKTMRKLLVGVFLGVTVFIIAPVSRAHAVPLGSDTIGNPCTPSSSSNFLKIPTWYQYLDGALDGGRVVDGTIVDQKCVPQLHKVGNDGGIDLISIWLIGLAVIEILLRLTGLITVGMVIFGGFKYITSQGNSDATKAARGTIVNAFIGMVITIIAVISVNFVAILLK
jgi:hypothetical protein